MICSQYIILSKACISSINIMELRDVDCVLLVSCGRDFVW